MNLKQELHLWLLWFPVPQPLFCRLYCWSFLLWHLLMVTIPSLLGHFPRSYELGTQGFPHDLGSPICPCFRSQVLDSIVGGVIQNQIYSTGIHMEKNGCLKFNRIEHWWPTSGSIRQQSPGSHCFCFLPKDLHQNIVKKRANLFFSFPSCLFSLYSCYCVSSSNHLDC